jgi:hypothetical protein
MVVECRRWLASYDQASGPAQDGVIRHWLVRLLPGLAGDRTADDIRLSLASFAFALADKPSYCFDDRSLRRAMKHFKRFYPTAGELIEFMDRIEAEGREDARRVWAMVDIGVRRPKPGDPNWTAAPDRPKRSPDELKAVADICAGIRAKLAEADLDRHAAPKPAPQKEAAE